MSPTSPALILLVYPVATLLRSQDRTRERAVAQLKGPSLKQEDNLRARVSLSFLFLMFVLVGPSEAASFDCVSAATSVEQAICSDRELSTLDERMSVLYGRAVSIESMYANIHSGQRHWLQGVRNICTDRACLKNAYESRISALEAIAGAFDSVPTSEVAAPLCNRLVDPKIRKALLEDPRDTDDINNDGVKERTESCWSGTMNTPCARYFGADGKEVVVQTDGYEWKDYWTYGRGTLRALGRTWSLHSYDDDLRKPAYLSYATPSNREFVVCEFNNEIIPYVAFFAEDYQQVCDDVLAGETRGVEVVDLTNRRHNTGSADPDEPLELRHSVLIDINNDGKLDRVLEDETASGGGRGCDANRFWLIHDDGNYSQTTPEQRKLDSMLAIGGRSCGVVKNRLLKVNGKVFVESNIENNDYYEHALSLWLGEDIKTVCIYKTQVRTTVR